MSEIYNHVNKDLDYQKLTREIEQIKTQTELEKINKTKYQKPAKTSRNPSPKGTRKREWKDTKILTLYQQISANNIDSSKKADENKWTRLMLGATRGPKKVHIS